MSSKTRKRKRYNKQEPEKSNSPTSKISIDIVDDFTDKRALEVFTLFSKNYLNDVPFFDANSAVRNSSIPFLYKGRLQKLVPIAHKYYLEVKSKLVDMNLDEYLCAFIYYYTSITHLDSANYISMDSGYPATTYYYITQNKYPGPKSKRYRGFYDIVERMDQIVLELSAFPNIGIELQTIQGGKKSKKHRKTIKYSKMKINKRI